MNAKPQSMGVQEVAVWREATEKGLTRKQV